MKNGIFHVTEGKMEQIKNEFDHKTFLVELEGGQIATLNDYFCVMSKKCCFPRKSNMWATYNDWMMDFSWIEKDMSIVIVIYRNLLGGLYRENPVKSRNYEAVKSSKKWENVGNSYIIPALLLYRYFYI